MKKQQLIRIVILAAVMELRVVSVLADDHSWEDIVQHFSSPEEMSQAVHDRLTYLPDMIPEDEWRSGRDTWAAGAGDCEDYAAAVKDLSEAIGFNADIYVVESRVGNVAHAVAIGVIDGAMWMSSNGQYQDVQSLSNAKEMVIRDLGWSWDDITIYKVVNGRKASNEL